MNSLKNTGQIWPAEISLSAGKISFLLGHSVKFINKFNIWILNIKPLPLTKRVPSQNSCIFSLCLFQHKDPLLPGRKPKPYQFSSYVPAWNVLPAVSTKAKPFNILSISQEMEIISVSSGTARESPSIVWGKGITHSLVLIAIRKKLQSSC